MQVGIFTHSGEGHSMSNGEDLNIESKHFVAIQPREGQGADNPTDMSESSPASGLGEKESAGRKRSEGVGAPSGEKLPVSKNALASVKASWESQVRKISEELDRWEKELAQCWEILRGEIAPDARRVRRLIRLLRIRRK
jgi:hypothetical protein